VKKKARIERHDVLSNLLLHSLIKDRSLAVSMIVALIDKGFNEEITMGIRLPIASKKFLSFF